MTTIVWNGKTGELAADRRVTWGNGRYQDNFASKIFMGKDFFLAIAGNFGPWMVYMNKLSKGTPFSEVYFHEVQCSYELLKDMLKEDEGVCGLLVHVEADTFGDDVPMLTVFELYSSGIFGEMPAIENAAIGSGAEFALGALAAGASTLQALEIAADYDLHTQHGPFQVVKCGG